MSQYLFAGFIIIANCAAKQLNEMTKWLFTGSVIPIVILCLTEISHKTYIIDAEWRIYAPINRPY